MPLVWARGFLIRGERTGNYWNYSIGDRGPVGRGGRVPGRVSLDEFGGPAVSRGGGTGPPAESPAQAREGRLAGWERSAILTTRPRGAGVRRVGDGPLAQADLPDKSHGQALYPGSRQAC